jgi:hypothetical protein
VGHDIVVLAYVTPIAALSWDVALSGAPVTIRQEDRKDYRRPAIILKKIGLGNFDLGLSSYTSAR